MACDMKVRGPGGVRKVRIPKSAMTKEHPCCSSGVLRRAPIKSYTSCGGGNKVLLRSAEGGQGLRRMSCCRPADSQPAGECDVLSRSDVQTFQE
nr:hypothetical protein CFP56_64590 [Quercus suber]